LEILGDVKICFFFSFPEAGKPDRPAWGRRAEQKVGGKLPLRGPAFYLGGAEITSAHLQHQQTRGIRPLGLALLHFSLKKEAGGKPKFQLDSKHQTGQNSSLWWIFLVVAATSNGSPKKFMIMRSMVRRPKHSVLFQMLFFLGVEVVTASPLYK
jgi:hypothetical protein